MPSKFRKFEKNTRADATTLIMAARTKLKEGRPSLRQHFLNRSFLSYSLRHALWTEGVLGALRLLEWFRPSLSRNYVFANLRSMCILNSTHRRFLNTVVPALRLSTANSEFRYWSWFDRVVGLCNYLFRSDSGPGRALALLYGRLRRKLRGGASEEAAERRPLVPYCVDREPIMGRLWLSKANKGGWHANYSTSSGKQYVSRMSDGSYVLGSVDDDSTLVVEDGSVRGMTKEDVTTHNALASDYCTLMGVGLDF